MSLSDRSIGMSRRLSGRIREVEAFVPLVANAGAEVEVAWGKAQVLMRTRPTMVHVFLMRGRAAGPPV